ncbi:hypothetical protein NYY92_11360, partial [Acinetobacter baumannii]|nr:hypothetical protein [Acinetobacter baumannii]
MTVQINDRLSQLYVGNGVNTRFDFIFRVFDQEDETGVAVRVKVGNDFEFLDEAKYTVTVNPENLGGYVDFIQAPDSQTYFYIIGKTPVDQTLDITNYDNFYPDALERALDKTVAILQEKDHTIDLEKQSRILADEDFDAQAQTRENLIKNDLQSQLDFVSENTTNQLEEAIANGAVSALAITTVDSLSDLDDLNKWDGRTVYVKNVANFKYDSADEEWVLVGNTAVSVVDSSGRTQQELNDSQKPYNRPNISVFNFGAKGDKVTDDILSLEAARDYAAANDGCGWIPPVTAKHQDGAVSDYAFRITRTLFIPAKLDFIMDSPILWDGPA